MIAEQITLPPGIGDDENRSLSPFVLNRMFGPDIDAPDNLYCLLTVNWLNKPETPLRLNVYSNIKEFDSHLLVARCLMAVSEETGNHVQLRPEYGFCPILSGSDSMPVLLYRFVEILEESVDYGTIKEELPTLSINQIAGAIAYLRKVAQFNTKGIDLDALEDSNLANDEAFHNDLREALADREVARVLNFGK